MDLFSKSRHEMARSWKTLVLTSSYMMSKSFLIRERERGRGVGEEREGEREREREDGREREEGRRERERGRVIIMNYKVNLTV